MITETNSIDSKFLPGLRDGKKAPVQFQNNHEFDKQQDADFVSICFIIIVDQLLSIVVFGWSA